MADKNYRSFEDLHVERIEDLVLHPDDPKAYNDTAKFWRCRESDFVGFVVFGCKEDVGDVGQETKYCTFQNWLAHARGEYVFTIKGNSENNLFQNIEISQGGSTVDIDIGNWHSFNFGPNRGNIFDNVWRHDGKPVTIRYRFFAGKPVLKRGEYKILWFQSFGLTVFWWAKYLWHVILKRPDKAVSTQ